MDESNQRLGLVCIELVDDEEPLCGGIRSNGIENVLSEICFGAGLSDRGIQNGACRDKEVGDQAEMPMPCVLTFLTFYEFRLARQSRVYALYSLYPGSSCLSLDVIQYRILCGRRSTSL